MDPDNSERYEAVALQCFACATRDAEKRHASSEHRAGRYGDAAFDGLYIAVTERGAVDG